MPKPVKKKPGKRRSPSSDPMTRARQLMAEHMEKAETGRYGAPMPDSPLPAVPSFQDQLSAHMAKIGAKGGKIGGKRRLETLSAGRRKELARHAALERWRNKK